MAPREGGQGQPKRAPDAAPRAHEEANVPDEATTKLSGTGSDDTVAAAARAHETDEAGPGPVLDVSRRVAELGCGLADGGGDHPAPVGPALDDLAF